MSDNKSLITFNGETITSLQESLQCEWLETDGLGGYASGTITGIRTRRYHSLLLSSLRPPTERIVFVNGIEEQVEADGDCLSISSQKYKLNSIYPEGYKNIESFSLYPWPTWRYFFTTRTGKKIIIEKEIFIPRYKPTTIIRWRIIEGEKALLTIRPLLSCRDYHQLHKRNSDLNQSFTESQTSVSWQPYKTLPAVNCGHNGNYHHLPYWYYNFQYDCESERGLESGEDLWSPGQITYELFSNKNAVMILSTQPVPKDSCSAARKLASRERIRRGANPKNINEVLKRSAEQYIVKRGKGLTVIAGYPWFTDWGRDTFISLRGMISAGMLYQSGMILREWAKTVNKGMLPNHFPDAGETPLYNSVDASLWYVNTAWKFLSKTKFKDLNAIAPAILAIMRGYRDGTRYSIKCDNDGLIFAGEEGSQLTWMDAKVDDTCFSPRIGKPVEIQALWLSNIKIILEISKRIKNKSIFSKTELKTWNSILNNGINSFRTKFWNEEKKMLYDVVDGPNGNESECRPNQVIAIAIAKDLIGEKRSKAILKAVEEKLFTPLGLRTLSKDSAGYKGRYTGTRKERDAAYHNGTVWPWLLGCFIEAWCSVRKNTKSSRKEAQKYLCGIEKQIMTSGLGHISEIADGDEPHEPKGCPFQAWSVMEILRLYCEVISED